MLSNEKNAFILLSKLNKNLRFAFESKKKIIKTKKKSIDKESRMYYNKDVKYFCQKGLIYV